MAKIARQYMHLNPAISNNPESSHITADLDTFSNTVEGFSSLGFNLGLSCH